MKLIGFGVVIVPMLLSLDFCRPNPPQCPPTPSPTSTPSPTPKPTPPNTCAATGKQCDCQDLPPGVTDWQCVICDPQVPGGVKNIGVANPCPPVEPTPVPPSVCYFPQGVPDNEFHEVTNPKTLASQWDQIVSSHTGCAINSDCVLGQSDPQFYLASMVSWAQTAGLCAGQHVTGVTDEISIARSCNPGTVWENYHTVNFGSPRKVSWSGGGARSGWTIPMGCGITSVPTPRPTPTPTDPALICPNLTNLKMKLEILADPVVDVTPRGPDCDRCASINKSCDQGVCPLGPEGPTPPDNAQRIACEDFYGPYIFTLNGQPCTNPDTCFHHNDNPLQVKVKGHGLVEVTATRNGLKNSIQVP